jgi:hypothetical protein
VASATSVLVICKSCLLHQMCTVGQLCCRRSQAFLVHACMQQQPPQPPQEQQQQQLAGWQLAPFKALPGTAVWLLGWLVCWPVGLFDMKLWVSVGLLR